MRRDAVTCVVSVAMMAFLGCKEKKDDETTKTDVAFIPNLLRLEASNAVTTSMRLADTEFLTMDVAIKSLKYPIANIQVSDAQPDSTASGNNSIEVYRCKEQTMDGCMVELTGDALSNLLPSTEGIAAKVGTYTAVSIGLCPEGTTAEDTVFKITAEANVNGTTYYTNQDSGLAATGPAQEITVKAGGGCATLSHLPQPLEITADGLKVPEDTAVAAVDENGQEQEPVTEGMLTGNLPVRLYFDLANAAYASGGTSNTGAQAPNTNGCLGASAQTPYICVNFPKVVGTVDAAEPSITRLIMNESTIWGFYQGSGEVPFGAYQRVFFGNKVYEGQLPTTLMGADFKKPVANEDGTLTVETYNDGRWMKAPAFKLETHTGELDWSGTPTSYSAVKLD